MPGYEGCWGGGWRGGIVRLTLEINVNFYSRESEKPGKLRRSEMNSELLTVLGVVVVVLLIIFLVRRV